VKTFLLGDYRLNAGPSNVNRSLVTNSDSRLDYVKSQNRILRKIERIAKCLFYKKLIISGGITKFELSLARLLHHDIYYLMHGDARYETMINKLNTDSDSLELFDTILSSASKIIAVSERYSLWVKERYPQYASKITYVNNGLEIKRRHKVEKVPFTIAVSGGNRLIKNNDIVCEAVSILRDKGYEIKVFVFGRDYPNNADLSKYPFITKTGQLNKEEYYALLDKISLYVVDSEVEPFGLIIGDAINCNCSLLVSEIVGARSIMRMTEDDIVFDSHNINELSTKILNLFNNPNTDRLFESIDVEDVSEKSSYNKLMDIVCNE